MLTLKQTCGTQEKLITCGTECFLEHVLLELPSYFPKTERHSCLDQLRVDLKVYFIVVSCFCSCYR